MDNGSGKIRLLVWDERDVQQNLAEVIGREPELTDAPVMESVFLWLMDRCSDTETPSATVFKSVLSGTEEITAPKVIELRQSGFSVFVRGAANRDDDADFMNDIMTQIDRTAGDGRLAEVIVASHVDTFESRLESLASQGVKTAVVAFRERAGFAAANPKIDFIDLESIPELFRDELPRTNLYDIPEDGRALAPLGFPTRRSGRGTATSASAATASPASTGTTTSSPSSATSTATSPSKSASPATPAAAPVPVAPKPADVPAPAPKPVAETSPSTPAAPPPPPAPNAQATPKATAATSTAPPPPAPSRTAPPPPSTPSATTGPSVSAPVAAAPVVAAGAAAAAVTGGRAPAPAQPSREAVFDHVSDLVAAHGAGAGLRAGDLDTELDRKFPGFDESAIGFGDRDELAEAVANDRNFVVDRDDLDRPILRLRTESGSSGTSALDDLLSGIKPPRRRSRT